jgi:hypothetical protein
MGECRILVHPLNHGKQQMPEKERRRRKGTPNLERIGLGSHGPPLQQALKARFSAGAMFFGCRAELFEQYRKPENFFRIGWNWPGRRVFGSARIHGGIGGHRKQLQILKIALDGRSSLRHLAGLF